MRRHGSSVQALWLGLITGRQTFAVTLVAMYVYLLALLVALEM